MTDTIDFYFDFSSSYSYLAQARITEIEDNTGKEVLFKPIVLGAVFQVLAHTMPDAQSAKMAYMQMDLARGATLLAIDYRLPPVFPFNAIFAMRLFYAINQDYPCKAREFAQAVFAAAYAAQQDMSDQQLVTAVAQDMAVDTQTYVDESYFNLAKQQLKQNTDAAIAAGVFGAPSFVYQQELFWGADRIDTLIKTLC